MMLRRSPFGLFLLVGMGILLGAALFGSSGAVSGLVAAPFLILGFVFKIVLFFILFGLMAKMFTGAGSRNRRGWNRSGPSRPWWSEEGGSPWSARRESSGRDEPKPAGDRFEEWHRMAHARQEVDDHTPPVEP